MDYGLLHLYKLKPKILLPIGTSFWCLPLIKSVYYIGLCSLAHIGNLFCYILLINSVYYNGLWSLALV